MKKYYFFLLAFTFLWATATLAQSQTPTNQGQIRGFLYDASTGEPLIFSLVFLKETQFGTTTDVNGYFSLTRIPEGKYNLNATSLGYDTISENISIKAGQMITRKFYLKEILRQTGMVEITGSKSKLNRANTVNLSLTQITPREIKLMPSVGGEPDLAQYLQVVPGVVFTGDQGGQLYIRGGSPVQNLTLLDGMVIYNPFHSIGLFSVFETDIIKNTDIYTGGFGAEYGGRASSVINVQTIDGNKNRLSGKLGINPFTARALIEGPLLKPKSDDDLGITFLLSGRTSYLDRTSKTFYDYASQNGQGLPFSFRDAFGKLTLNSGSGSKISFSGFNYSDRANLGRLLNFGWDAYGLGTQFILLPEGSPVLITGNVGYSNYSIGLKEETTLPRNSSVGGLNGGLDFTYNFKKDEFKYGVNVVVNNTSFEGVSPTGIITRLEAANTEIAGYMRYKYQSTRLIIDPGIRLQYYAGLNLFSPEPRLGIKFMVTEKIRLKVGTGIYSQNLLSTQSDRDVVGLFNGFITSPTAVFDAGGQKIPNVLQKATHFTTGIEWDVNDYLELNLEPYVKYWNQHININVQKQVAADPDFIMETSRAEGIDFLAKYDRDAFFLQFGYSLARITRTFGSVTYSPNFDRRHNLNFLASYKFGSKKQFEADVRWNLGSGFPFTQTRVFYENVNFLGGIDRNPNLYNGNLGVYYGTLADFNRGRLPYYHRLDISVKYKKSFTQNVNLELIAGCTNAYDRANLFYFDRINLKRVNQLPILPTLGMNLTF